jgi:hypothetical protein
MSAKNVQKQRTNPHKFCRFFVTAQLPYNLAPAAQSHQQNRPTSLGDAITCLYLLCILRFAPGSQPHRTAAMSNTENIVNGGSIPLAGTSLRAPLQAARLACQLLPAAFPGNRRQHPLVKWRRVLINFHFLSAAIW